VKFDYTYLYNRIADFAQQISPVRLTRYGDEKDILYPAGISIVDYLTLYKKVFMREASYALNYIAQKRLNEKSWASTDFGILDDHIKAKNLNDVKRLVKLEEKYTLLPYYDEIRRLTKVNWEDLYYNSRIIEMLLLEEAKHKNIILPTKIKDIEKMEFEGATRESEVLGSQFNIGKFDLTSAYPSMIVNFCLDTHNIEPGQTDDNININVVYFKQNSEALLPSVVKKILTIKDELKNKKKTDKSLQLKYDAIKGIVNSAFGVMGNQYFRLYDNRIASSITYLVRDLIHYTKRRLKEQNIDVIYWDTDSVFTTTKEDISDQLNQYILDWCKTFGKQTIDLLYEYEGYFTGVFFLGKCHYFGHIAGKDNPEIKGVEITRSNSSKYEAKFQQTLLEKILNKENQETVLEWINAEKERIKTIPIEEIGFPVKLQIKKYKNIPIFVRAYEYTKKIYSKFELTSGQLFYYVYIKPIGKDENVLAFTEENKNFINWSLHLDWNEMIRRNIISKSENIFEAQGWDTSKLLNPNQAGLF
jgi:DNA polymerase elongation subunit (family B)